MQTVKDDKQRGEWAPFWSVIKETEWLLEDTQRAGGDTAVVEQVLATLRACQPIAERAWDGVQKANAENVEAERNRLFTKLELATLLGVTTRTIERAISALVKRKFIFSHGGGGRGVKALFTAHESRIIAESLQSPIPECLAWK